MIIGLEWNQADDITQWIAVASYDYLIDDGGAIKKPTMNGLETVTGSLDRELFELHGTKELSEIIGLVNKDVDMVYQEDMGDKKIYGYKLVGYRDLVVTPSLNSLVKSADGKYYTYRDSEFVEVAPLTEEDFTNNSVDYSELNQTLDKETLKLNVIGRSGIGEVYSAKLRPSNWNGLIKGIDDISGSTKTLIKTQEKILSVVDGEWRDITDGILNINSITQDEYEVYGMDSLASLPMSTLNQEDEFEVLVWTNEHEILEKTAQGTEQAIDEGKLFSTIIEDFSVITGLTVS